LLNELIVEATRQSWIWKKEAEDLKKTGLSEEKITSEIKNMNIFLFVLSGCARSWVLWKVGKWILDLSDKVADAARARRLSLEEELRAAKKQ
jgi:hypothetical protein